MFNFKKKDKDFVNAFDSQKFNNFYNQIKKFFGFEGDLPQITIHLLYSPEEYSLLTGDLNFEKWKAAMTGNNTTIYVFSPSTIEKYTMHKKEEVFGIIIHELTHLFYGYSKLNNLPMINEGISKFFQNGPSTRRLDAEIKTLRDGNSPKYNYIVGHFLISKIIEKLGEDQGGLKIISFIKETNRNDSEIDLFDKFESVFGLDAKSFIQSKGGVK